MKNTYASTPGDGDQNKRGKLGWVLLWLLGVPIPFLLILFLVRGCT